MTDERQGLPSASAAGRLCLCPGSFLLEQTRLDTTSVDAQRGDRIHSFLAGKPVMLSADDREVADSCSRMERLLVRDTFGEVELDVVRETRLWARNEHGERAWSGKADVVYSSPTRLLVCDYKTGRGEVEDATGNMQLRALAVLNDAGFGSVRVAIIQPLASPQMSMCDYSSQDMEIAREQINALMAMVREPGQPRHASLEACKYCRAKAVCPEALEAVEQLQLVCIEPSNLALSAGKVASFLDAAQLAESVIDAVRYSARMMIESGITIPGWKLKPGVERETITKPEQVFGRFLAVGGTQEQFMSAVGIAKGKLKDALKAATGAKGRALESALATMLEDCTETKKTASSLAREKELI